MNQKASPKKIAIEVQEQRVMPEYEYRCEGCGKRFVRHQTFAEHDRARRLKCPKCGSTKVSRVIGTVFAKTSKKS